MTDIGKYISLKQVVLLFIDQENKSAADADRYWILAWRALRLIYTQVAAEPKSLRILKNANDTVTLPADYNGWSKIGVLTENNEVATLRINNGLAIWNDNNPNRITNLIPDVPSNQFNINPFPFYLNYWYNGTCNVLYDCLPEGINYPGQCKVDERNNVIILSPDFQYDSILLEYKSIPQKDSDYQIETDIQEAVIAFIEWKLKTNTEQNFYARLREARRTLPNKRVTLQQIDQAVRGSNFYKIRI